MNPDLIDLANTIESFVEDATAKIGIAIETGPDEAFFVASKDGLLRLAVALIRSAAISSQHESTIKPELIVHWNTETHGIFEAASEISISAECSVNGQGDVRETLLYFQELSPSGN